MINNIKSIITRNKNMLGILCLFVIVQPFLDILPLFENENLSLFGFTIPTLVRCLFIGLLGLILLKHLEKKNFKFLIGYFILILIYTLFHHRIASDNSLLIPNNYMYSLSSELFYIIRMLLPLAIIQFVKCSKIDEDRFLKTIVIASFLIGLIIFIGNTLCISYVSYGEGFTKINWIGWFLGKTNNYKFELLTSKGWFYMANQVSGIMVLLFPFCIFALLKKKSILNIITTILLIISMVMVGTRVAAYGWLLIIISYLIAIAISEYVYKNKGVNKSSYSTLIIITIIGLLFLAKAPITTREYGYKLGDLTTLKERPEIDFSSEESLDKVYTYIEESYEVFGVQKEYVFDKYNYKFDPVFWYEVFDRSVESGVIENREMQRMISNKIIRNNNSNIKYQLFGYSFSRMRNGKIYMEHDIIVQIFTMGYLGAILLLGPYIAIIGMVCLKLLKGLKQKFDLINVAFIISMGITIGSSILTGHILDELFATIYIGFICGYFLKDMYSKKELKNES